ncbi:MAG: signal peptide prediction [Ancalomicrobiaceae bacterium]|nr:signal peptide prediction [Ancalomicrobiaceae bacterium]
MAGKQPKLRVVGRREVLPKPILEQAARDLGFELEFELLDTVKSLRRIVMQPESFDVYHQWHTVDLIWTARAIRPIDLGRIDEASRIRAAVSTRRDGGKAIGSLFEQLFLQPDGTLSSVPSDKLIMLPLLHGVDAFAYLPEVPQLYPPGTQASWGWLLDPRLHGRVAMMSDPVLGMIEAALAVEAAETVVFDDIANLSIEEIDLVADVLMHKKKIGHFRAIWSNYQEAARWMQRGGVLLQSMFSPALSLLRSQNVPVISGVPKEGYRGWHVDLCISSAAEGDRLEAAYAYLNWWMNGLGGAMVARQGYYFVLPDLVRPHLSEAEWAYWYEGRRAEVDLPDLYGEVSIRAGDLREGGSYYERMSRVRVWNTFMDEHAYLVRRWREFLEA